MKDPRVRECIHSLHSRHVEDAEDDNRSALTSNPMKHKTPIGLQARDREATSRPRPTLVLARSPGPRMHPFTTFTACRRYRRRERDLPTGSRPRRGSLWLVSGHWWPTVALVHPSVCRRWLCWACPELSCFAKWAASHWQESLVCRAAHIPCACCCNPGIHPAASNSISRIAQSVSWAC